MNRLLVALLILAVAIPAYAAPKADHPERLVLVYLDADNNLYSYGLDDLNEMTEAARNTEYAKVIVLFDGQNIGDTALYEVEPGGYREIQASRVPSEANMGDPGTLRMFIKRAVQTYQPRYVFVDLRDHGGARSGLMVDDSNNDMLSVEELASAISGLPITILGFDACLMGNLETLYEISTVFHGLVVASTYTEPGEGRDYHRLNVFSGEASPYDVGEAVVSYYYAYYGSGVTLGLYDLAALPAAIPSIDAYAKLAYLEALSNLVEFGSLARYAEIRSAADSIAGDGTSDIHVGTNSAARKAYTVYLEAGKAYEITLSRNGSEDLDLYVFEPGSPINASSAFAYSRYDQPEKVSFVAPVSGNRTIAVDHYSAETSPVNFTLTVDEVASRHLDVLFSKTVYGPLKELPFEPTFVRYAEPYAMVSITAGNVADLGMAMSDYESMAFAQDAPYRAALVRLLTEGLAESVNVSYALENETIGGIETTVYVEASAEAEVRLYNPLTGERIETDGNLSGIPMFEYEAYLVEPAEIPGRAIYLGTGYFGDVPSVIVPDRIGSSGNVTISGFASFGPIEAYLNGTYIGTIEVENHSRSLGLEGFGTLSLAIGNETYNVTIFRDDEAPDADISVGFLNRDAAVSVSVSDESLKSVSVYLDGIPVAAEFVANAQFARNVTVVAEDYAGHVTVANRTVLAETAAPQNESPSISVRYEVDNGTQSVKLYVNVTDDDAYADLYVYVNGTLKYHRSVATNTETLIELGLGYGSFNITIVAVDPYNASDSETIFVEFPRPPEESGSSAAGESGFNRRLAVLAIIAVALIVLARLRKKE